MSPKQPAKEEPPASAAADPPADEGATGERPWGEASHEERRKVALESVAGALAPSTLPAVRPTAAPCGRGARPLLRPGSWGRMAAPYNAARCWTFPR